MADIRPNQLPDAVPFNSNDKIIVDQNANGVRKAEPGPFINFIAPIASQSEAETGTDNTKRMTPLRTKQSIASEVGVTLASKAQGDKADTAVQTVNTKIGPDVVLDKSDVGLGDADNTSDMAKPVSTATQTALNGKVDTTSPRLIPSGGDTDQVLVKSSDDDYDLKWETVAAATAVSYAPQTLTESQKTQARENINSASLGENSFVGDQEIDGSVTATEFIGDGSQLNNLYALGIGQTWKTVSRTTGVNYQNTSGKPIVFSIVASRDGSALGYVGIAVGESVPSMIEVSRFTDDTSTLERTVSAIIPPQNYYKFESNNVSIFYQVELS